MQLAKLVPHEPRGLQVLKEIEVLTVHLYPLLPLWVESHTTGGGIPTVTLE